ncbi:hypothetical protein [Tenacibaculum xiamenense]|uniref:hypothetical protein n=1 Tax=Tenacibaculum xiamenense TaxID=1261553 RepID=UPI003894D642
MKKTVKNSLSIESMIYDNIKKSQEISEAIVEEGNILKIQVELNRKRAEAEMNELNAKISQELAIAERIKNAVDVEIEEIYENSNQHKLGGGISQNRADIEIGGGNRKVAKRIYKFKGNVNRTEG